MFSAESKSLSPQSFFSWQFLLFKLLLVALLAVLLEKPSGSLSGQISLEQKGFGLQTYDIKANRVYAIAQGPRKGPYIECGVWVNTDGSFRLDHLPIGEYQLKVRAKGFESQEINGLYVEEGKVTKLGRNVAMHILEPSVSIGESKHVFTTGERPQFFVDAVGATKFALKVYKVDLRSFLFSEKVRKLCHLSPNLTVYKNHDAGFTNPCQDRQPVLDIKRDLQLDYTDSASANIVLSDSLAPGDYFTYVEVDGVFGNTAQNVAWFSVSDLGLILKRDTQKAIVRAIDLKTLHPVANCSLQAYESETNQSLTPIYKTGSDGVVQIPLDRQVQIQKQLSYEEAKAKGKPPGSEEAQACKLGNVSFDIAGYSGANKCYGCLEFEGVTAPGPRTYFYTDKPIYRLGQTVLYKGIVRMPTPDGYQNPGATSLAASIEDPDNNELWKGKLETNSFGCFHGSFAIPEDAKTGAYQLAITYADGNVTYQPFEIAQYRKPEYQVEVTALAPQVVAGSELRVRVKASYFFGAPVANASIKYSIYAQPDWGTRFRLMPRPDYYSFFDDWDGNTNYSSGGQFLSDGFAQTDENGEAIVSIKTKTIERHTDSPADTEPSDQVYRVEAAVTDLSRLTVVGNGTATVTAGQFALFVTPQSYVAKVGESMNFDVQAVNYNGKPKVNQSISLTLTRWLWDSSKSTYRGQEQETQTEIKTDDRGKASASIFLKDQWPSDTFYITASAKDEGNHLIEDTSSVWIASNNRPFFRTRKDSDQQPLMIKLDKAVYKPGDLARLMISGPLTGKEGADAIVSLEGAKIYDYKLVPMSSTARLFEIPIKREYAPNVFVSVVLVGPKHAFYSSEQLLKVSPEKSFLAITIKSDKDKYKPGEQVKYTITAKHEDGSAAANCDLSLGVVDESIYSIRAETAEDIGRFFFFRRDNIVTTSCSFPESYSGGPDKIEPRLRKDFKDTAAWLPDLITDKNGIAIASIKLPDNLTTWRATVHAVDQSTDVGSGLQKIVSTQDLILRLALPRFFTQGDQGLITAVVHNYTDKKQTVKLVVSPSQQFEVKANLNQSLALDSDKAGRFSWPVSIKGAGIGLITAKAIGETAGDAVQEKLPIRPFGIPAFTAKSGLITETNAKVDIPIGLSADVSPGTAKGILTLAASSIGPVLGNFDKLIDYPYGCTEQTMSRLTPSIVAMQLHNKLGLKVSDADKKKFADVYKLAMEKLESYHHADGGWGWWENDQSNPYLSAYVVQGLGLLKLCGYNENDELITSGLKYMANSCLQLKKQLADPKHVTDSYLDRQLRTDLAKMIYTLSLWNTWPEDLISRLSAKAGGKSLHMRQDLGDGSAETINKKLSSETLAWLLTQGDQLMPEARSYVALTCANLGDDQNAAKMYHKLIALADNTDNLTNWDHSKTLLSKLNVDSKYDYDYRFTGVETTALALKTVLALEPGNEERIEAIKRWIILQRDKNGWENTKTTAAVFLVLLQDELQYRASQTTNFTTKAIENNKQLLTFLFQLGNIYGPEQSTPISLNGGPKTLTISKDGPGRLYYNSLLTYFRNLLPGDQIAEKGIPAGLKITRQFFRLKPSAVTTDGVVHFHTEPITDGNVKAGETVMMKVFVDAPVRLPYVKIEAAIPSGAEVVEDARENSTDNESDQSRMEGDWGKIWWTHQDILDDRIVYFGAAIKPGKSEFHTMLRVELPGKLELNPVALEGMYSDKIRAYSGLDMLTVSE